MKQSTLFAKTTRDISKEEVSKNAQLLLRAGFIYKEMAGAYAYLPLGLRVLENIKSIIREEMNAAGCSEIIMTALQRKELWEKTDRWSDEAVDVWFKSKLKNDTEVGFGWSHEEPIAEMLTSYINSFRDLPVYVYQFQTKLRNELRAKSGIMRGREFIMKDLYSFSIDEAAHEVFYNNMIKVYFNVFNRTGIGQDTFVTFASGGAFTKFSHEFQTITDAGEDIIYINREKNIAINEEILNDETLKNLGVTKDELEQVKTAEVGNIFNFGTKKCEQLGLYYTDSESKKIPVWLGSYGIGVTRLMGVIVEKNATENAMVWPKSVSPFALHLIELSQGDESIKKEADRIYHTFTQAGIEVLYDERAQATAGQKFADSDIIGIPLRVVVSKKTLAEASVEHKDRIADTQSLIKIEEFLGNIRNYV